MLKGFKPPHSSLYWYDDKFIKSENFKYTSDYDEYLQIRKAIQEQARQNQLNNSQPDTP